MRCCALVTSLKIGQSSRWLAGAGLAHRERKEREREQAWSCREQDVCQDRRQATTGVELDKLDNGKVRFYL